MSATATTRRTERPSLESQLVALARTVATRHGGATSTGGGWVSVHVRDGGTVSLILATAHTEARVAPDTRVDWLALVSVMRELHEGAARLRTLAEEERKP